MKSKTYVIISFLVAVVAVWGSKAYAAEPISKDIAFEITQDYEACSFTITTQVQGNFIVELNKENDDQTYTAMIEDDVSCIISVEDVKAGRWHVTVTEVVKDDPETQIQETEEWETQEEAVTEDVRTADEVIGKIQVQAKAIDKTSFSIGNVDVARDIVGLQKYFKDDAIVIEWTDTSCGNVNVSVIDAYTNQILDKQTVTGRYYEFELPALVSEITIDIVPATSSNITGANSTYTLAVINDPDAVVTYEDKEYTNEDSVPVNIQLNKAYSLLFMVNGAEVKTTGMLAAGIYTYTVPVTEGMNEVLTYVMDSEHNMRSASYSIIRDSIKPALTLDMEYDGMTTYDDTILVTGTIKDYDTFMINETKPIVAGDGSFKSEYILRDGENVLDICATDIAGNETLYRATVTKMIKETPRIMDYIGPIGLIAVLIAVIGYKFYHKHKGKGDKAQKPAQEETEREEKKKIEKDSAKKMPAGKKYALYAIVGAACLIGSYQFLTNVLLYGYIPSHSMEPMLKDGDYVIVNGLAYLKHEPQRGDVIIFRHDGVANEETIIKRVIGLPGDSLVFVDGYLYINGELVYESYLPEDTETNSSKDFDHVPEGCYFVMGDNREDSRDSRHWDDPYVEKSEINGKLLSVVPVARLIDTIESIF